MTQQPTHPSSIMSQNISNSATSNLSPTQNQMSMQSRMQSQPPIPQQPSWPSSYYGQPPSQSPYMNPYMPHGPTSGVPNHTSSMSQPPLPPLSQKIPTNSSDTRTRAAYPPHSNLYSQPISGSGAPGSYYGYDPYYNQVSADPYLSHPSSAGAPHWSSSATNSSMMGSGSAISGAPLQPPLRQSGPTNSQTTSTALPPVSARPPPPSQTPERNPAPQLSSSDHMMSSYDRQRTSSIAQQSQHPSAILSQNMSSPSASTISPTQNQMGMQNRMQSQSQIDSMRSMNQQPNWQPSSYYNQPSQSPYMNPYMPSSAAPGHGSSLTQPPPTGQLSSKPPTNGNDRSTAYSSHSNLYGQPPSSGGPSNYYGYDQSYGQVMPDPYLHSTPSGAPHWPSSAQASSSMNSGPPPPSGPMQSQLRPQSSATGAPVQPPAPSTTLPPPGSRPPIPSQTPERSPSISTSYPSPNQQAAPAKSGSNSLAQLEQMVMPSSGQAAPQMKSPTHRSTTSSPITSTHQPSSMQYSYNSSGQSYFSSTSNQGQSSSSYYPSYESSDNVDPSKPSWPEQSSSTAMNPPPPSAGLDTNLGPYNQGYEGSSGYADYTQLSTPSQPRFPPSSDIPPEQSQPDKSDPYAIDSQTFEDHDGQAASSKSKKSRAKKGDESGKKEKRQRAPRTSKAAAAAAAAVAASRPPLSPSANSMSQGMTPTHSMPQTPDVPATAVDSAEKMASPTRVQPGPSSVDDQSGGAAAPPTLDSSSPSYKPVNEPPPPPVDSIPPPTMNQSTISKSPVNRSSANSPSVANQHAIPYPYSAPGPDGYSYGAPGGISQPSYYQPYGPPPSTGPEMPKPKWMEEHPSSVVNAGPSGPSMIESNVPVMSTSSYDSSNNYNQYTQPPPPQPPPPPPSQPQTTDQGLATTSDGTQHDSVQPMESDPSKVAIPQMNNDQDEKSAPLKAKKSKSKKNDDSSSPKKERRQRPSRAQKASAQPKSPASAPTYPDGISNDDMTQPSLDTQDPNLESANLGESNHAEEKQEQEPSAKPKRVRPKKSGGEKSKRKSRATVKPESTEPSDQPSIEQSVSDPSEQVNESANDSLEVSQADMASAETTPAKPKRIRIRDSSSKGKKKLPKFALKFAKTKKRKRLGSSDNEQSDLDKTPPPSPDEIESGVSKRRSARNTKKLKYNDDIELGFSESDDSQTPRKKSSANLTGDGDGQDDSVAGEEPTVFAAPVEDTMVVEKIMASRMGRRELEPEPGEVLPPDGTHIDIEEFYVKYKNMSYLHCDWRTLEELERGDRRVAQKVKRYKQKKDNNVFSFMDEDLFDPQYCEVDRILAVNEVEEMVPDSDDENEGKDSTEAVSNMDVKEETPAVKESISASQPMDIDETARQSLSTEEDKPDTITEKEEPEDVKSDVPKVEADESTTILSTNEASIAKVEPAVDESMQESNQELTATKDSTEKAIVPVSEVTEDQTQVQAPKKMKKKISRHYLVKWRALSYEDSTWELEEHLDSDKIKHFERFKDPPPKSKWKSVKRPKPDEWLRKEASPIYKNNNTLREYQLEGINWLSFCWHQGRNCILADEMGLGKTIQSIAFINEIHEKGIYGPFLIIVPLSTVGNWAREFETWTDLNVITYHGSSTSREMLKEYEMFYRNEQGNRITNVYKFQVMITTFEIILSDCLDLREIPWRCCIIDEAHRLKNRNCKLLEGLRLLNMEHRVLLTGTPLQNNVEELFSLLNFLEPTQFASTEQFLQEFGDLKTEAQVDKLKLILKPMMLRRLKEDVEKTLAPKEETIVEVELTNIQKKYYRAILERNFSFLQKGSTNNNMPNLMNTMMELRKCCIHPYLINGAEEQILYEAKQTKTADGGSMSSHQAMVNASGKLVLIDKLLPRLKADGHRVLIFSQMVRCLDILEDYVTHKHYPYERIDGRVRGSDRQQAIDRYSKPGSDRFVFLLCTRAGGLGINLTAADTVIIFDSDWNPQNDLQAQARCHRIGQSKAVKIYRLICRNTYEREMFDKASLKLGLDKAVLQSMNTQKSAGADQNGLTKKDIEELLRKGAYGALMDDDNAGDKFCEEDIDQILQRRTQVITIESTEAKGSTFSKATFSSSNNREDIELDDPNFWEKWAKKANIDSDDLLTKDELIQLAPRRRTQTKRYGADGSLLEMSDLESSEEDEETISMRTRGSRRGQSKTSLGSSSKRGKRNRYFDDDDDELMANIDGGYWSKTDCLKIEAGLLIYGWGRWEDIVSNNRFKRDIKVEDCENICRVILLYCLNTYKGDEKIKSFIWELIAPPDESTRAESDSGSSVSTRGRKPKSTLPISRKTVAEEMLDASWPKDAKNDPLIALPDDQYRRHLQRNCNRLLMRVKCLHYLKYDILKGYNGKIQNNCDLDDVDLPLVPIDGELPADWWDDEADKSLLVGIYKHGHDKFNQMRQDPQLCFLSRCGPPSNFDLTAEMNNRSLDYIEEDNKAYVNLKKTAAGACLHDLLNNVVRELNGASEHGDKSDEVVDENKNSILKSVETNDSLDNMCENGIGEMSQTSKMDITDDDSLLNEGSADATTTPPSVANGVSAPANDTENTGLLPFPLANDLNQRFRRLITAYQKNSKRLEIQLAQKARDELKKERTSKFEAAKNEREERKRFQAQKWSRREESDFAKAISFFGVEYDPKHRRHDWNKFRSIGKLDKKLDETLEEYYKAFIVMCKRVTSKPLTEDEERCSLNVEAIAEDRASRCLSRIEFFNKIRSAIRRSDLDKKLRLCQSQADLPDWWQSIKHDKDLLVAAARHGLYRLDYNLAHDPSLSFESVIQERVKNQSDNPPAPILIPLEQLQELLERNGVEYSRYIEHEDDSDIVASVISSLIDGIDSEDTHDLTHSLRNSSKTTRSSSALSRSSNPRCANTVARSVESSTSSKSLVLTSVGDSLISERRVAEVHPVMPDKIPEDLRKSHEAGELAVTIQSESVLLKLDDKPPMVLLGALNSIVIKIRWPRDKAIQTRLDNIIYLVENNEWPMTPKPLLPTITLPNHLSQTPTPYDDPCSPDDDAFDMPPSPRTEDGGTPRSGRHDSKDRLDTPLTRGRRGKGRRSKPSDLDLVMPPSQPEPELRQRDDRQAAAKLRNLLSQGAGSSRTSTPDKSSSRYNNNNNNNEKQGTSLSSLLQTFKQKKNDSPCSSRTREEKKMVQPEPNLATSTANLLPQILAKPEFRDLLANPETASILMNSLSSFPGFSSLGASLGLPLSGPSSMPPTDNLLSAPRSSSKSQRSERSSSKFSTEKPNSNAGISSLLATFKQQQQQQQQPKSSIPTRSRDSEQSNLPMGSNLIPQILANMKPEYRDLLANPDTASYLMNSLGGLAGLTNLANLRPTGTDNKTPVDHLLQSSRSSSSKGPPPAHQRSDNVPTAHGSTPRELRRNSQSNRDSPSASKSTRGKSSVPPMEIPEPPKSVDMPSRSGSSKRRGRPGSEMMQGPLSGADVLDLSSLQQARKGSSLLRSESRTRRGKDQPEEIPSVATRSSSTSSRSVGKSSSRNIYDQEQDMESQQQELQQPSQSQDSERSDERAGRSTRASKRIGSRIDALALNLQAKRLHRSDSPEPSPPPTRERAHDRQSAAHESSSRATSDHKSSKAPPAAHSGSSKSSSSVDPHRHRDKDKQNVPTTTSSHAVSTPSSLPSTSRSQDPLAQLMSKVATPTSSVAQSMQGQSNMAPQSRQQDPLAQLMSNPMLLAGLNPAGLGGGAGDLMNQLMRKTGSGSGGAAASAVGGSNDLVKNLLNEFIKNPSLASLDPNLLATLTAGLPMGSQSLPSFNLPTTATSSLSYGNYTNPLANPFLPFNMANLGMNNPLTNPLGLFPNLYMPPGYPTPQDQQQQSQQQTQQQQSRQQPNQSSGSNDGGPKDKKMRYSRK